MGLKLADLDKYTLGEIDCFTLEQLENMTSQELVSAVDAMREKAESECNPEKILTDEQRVYIVSIINVQNEIVKNKQPTMLKQISTKFAFGVIETLSAMAVEYVIKHHEEIRTALIQAYTLLKDLLNQVN